MFSDSVIISTVKELSANSASFSKAYDNAFRASEIFIMKYGSMPFFRNRGENLDTALVIHMSDSDAPREVYRNLQRNSRWRQL